MFPRNNSGRVCCLRTARRLALLVVLGIYAQLFPFGTTGAGQEAFRSSLAGQDAMEAKKRAASARQYNVKFANLALDLGTRLGIEYNDNIFYYGLLPVQDIILRPQLTTAAAWALTDKNRLNLNLGVGYAKYVNNPNLDTPFMTPGSDLSFDLYVRDFVINFHDRFSFLQDVNSYLINVTNVAYLKSFENTAGVLANWDLNKAVVSVGYDHYNYLSMTPSYDYLTRQSELFFARAIFAFNPIVWAGFELGGGLTTYDKNVLSGLTHVSGGALLLLRSSEFLSLRLAAGYMVYFADISGSFSGADDASGFYSDLTVNHKVNRKISYSASAGRQFQAGTSANLQDSYYLRGRASWNVIRKGTLGTSFSYEHSTETYRGGSFSSDYYGPGVDLTRSFSPKLSASLSYWYYLRDSSLRYYGYTQNRLAFELRYRF